MRHSLVVLLIVILAAGNLCALHFARWSTSMGTFTAELYDQWVPITANNFISLANSGFYNDLIFHRVVAGFVIQDGCPQGTGYGGPGYTIPDEFHPNLHHDQAGILAMARTSAPNSAGSQYYITLVPTPNLDGNYAIFGKVIQGLDTVLDIGQVQVDVNYHPYTPVTIDTLRILDLAIMNVTPSDSTTVTIGVNEPLMFIVEAISNLPTQFDWFVDGVEATGLDFIFETTFATPGTHSVSCLISNADWSHEIVWDILVQGTEAGELIAQARPGLEISPHPLREGATLKLASGTAGLYQVGVYDLKGRSLVEVPEPLKQGSEWYWDGRDDQGKRLPPGVYLIRAISEGRTFSRRCVLF
ncbi:MAG: peptidylprolyl isomerase [Candidatus Cloacimonetes bacterium]|nr:peptidylprolyl isomerase [Candidatus Cloacimonadota bacterium]